jgi:hypothetical protein
MARKKATGRNFGNKSRPVDAQINPLKIPHEGADAHGRVITLTRDETPTRIDEVTNELFYLGWAEYGSDESDPVWKIRRIQLVGTVWEQKYAGGEQEYRYAWSNRSMLNYA